MREFLFRGKRKDNGEWVQGLLWKKKYKTDKLFISYFPFEDDDEEVVVVDPETVGQYTGMKDKFGKKIFEGDILGRTNLIGRKYFGVVNAEVWSCSCCYTVFGFATEGNVELGESAEIVGNVYDNPELLKGGA